MDVAELLQGPLAALGVVLVVSGVLKLADPSPTTAMLRALRLPSGTATVVAVGLAEVIVGVAAFVFGGVVISLAVAALFAGFAVASAELLRRGERSISCGCFGARSATISGLHVAVDAGAALVALAAAVAGTPGFFDVQPQLPAAGVPQLALIALVAALIIAVLTVLAEALDAARPVPADQAGPVGSFRVFGGS